MRQILAVLLSCLLIAPDLPARTNHNWDVVQKLAPDSLVAISLWNGGKMRGRIISVSDSGVRLADEREAVSGPNSQLRELDRDAIRRIVDIHRVRPNLPDPGKWMATGALIGGGVGVTAGAVQDARHGNNGRWLLGGFAGAVIGLLGTAVVLGAVGVEKTAQGLHHNVIYEAAGPPPSSQHKS